MEFPQDFTARERALLGARFDELYAYATPQPARGVTVNALRCTPEWFAQHADFDAQPSKFCPTAFTTAADFRPGRHAWHHAGVLYAQEPSASAPAALLDVQPGMRVADLCAAPGGKTSQLAAALQGQGLLLANEFVAARAEILRQNLERMGVTNAVITNEDTARLAAAMPGQFDRVLVDAPCSGEGMFRKEAVAAAQHKANIINHCFILAKVIKLYRLCTLICSIFRFRNCILGKFAYLCAAFEQRIELWCNGNTADFGSVVPGSSPGSSTKLRQIPRNHHIAGNLLFYRFPYLSFMQAIY